MDRLNNSPYKEEHQDFFFFLNLKWTLRRKAEQVKRQKMILKIRLPEDVKITAGCGR